MTTRIRDLLKTIEDAPIMADKAGVTVMCYPWGCVDGRSNAHRVVTPEGMGIEVISGAHRFLIPHSWITRTEESPTSLWLDVNTVNQSVNRGATMTKSSDMLKFLVQHKDVCIWFYIDAMKTTYNRCK